MKTVILLTQHVSDGEFTHLAPRLRVGLPRHVTHLQKTSMAASASLGRIRNA